MATNDTHDVLTQFFRSGHGSYNASGYVNSRVDELIDQIGRETITFARDAMIDEVWRTVLDDIVYLPIHHPVVVWAMREGLDIPANPHNSPRFREAYLGK